MGVGKFRRSFDVSRETIERLSQYVALVEKWNPRINLVSKNSLSEIWERHIVDSAQVFEFGAYDGKWADIGSGGGFPGIVAAILAKDVAPACEFVLVESDLRKSAFLRTVVRETQLNAIVVGDRIEKIPSLEAKTLTARALAPLDTLLGFAKIHLAPDGKAIFPKGASFRTEIKKARENWNFELEEFQSTTDTEATILRVGAISNA